jgi:hypothetical protein
MQERHTYRPSGCNQLEARVALTHGGVTVPALISTLSVETIQWWFGSAHGRAGERRV